MINVLICSVSRRSGNIYSKGTFLIYFTFHLLDKHFIEQHFLRSVKFSISPDMTVLTYAIKHILDVNVLI